MSLRDQLLAKGLVSKKDARKAGQEARKKRKKGQGSREKKRVVEAREQALEAQERKRRKEQSLQARKEHEARREASERVVRVRQIIAGNRLRARGPVPYFVRGKDGKTLVRLQVTEAAAFRLRNGEVAVAWLEKGHEVEYVLIWAKAADRLEEVDPERVLHRVTDTHGISARDLRFEQRTWAPDLRARRVLTSPG